MKTKMIILTLVCLCIAVALILGISNTTGLFSATQNETIKVGVIMPLTGELAMYGLSSKAALEYSADKINYTVNGKKIEFVFEDGLCDGKDATKAFNKLLNIDNIKYVITGCSSESLSVAHVAEQNKVLHISACGTSPDVEFAGDYTFALKPLDNFEEQYVASYIYKNLNAKNVSIIACTNDWCKGAEKVFTQKFTQLGGKILTIEHNSGGASDMKTQLLKIKETNTDIIIALQYPEAFINIANQTKQLDIKTKMFVPILINQDIISKLGDIIDGYYTTKDASSVSDPNFETELKKRTGMQQVDSSYCSQYAYDSLTALKLAIEEAKSTDPSIVKNKLYNVSFDGIAGKHQFNKNGVPTTAEYKIMQVQNGKLVEVK